MARDLYPKNIETKDLIYPYFVIEGRSRKQAIDLFPGVYRFSVDKLLSELDSTVKLGINKILLFGIPDKKDIYGSQGYKEDNIVSTAVRAIKKKFRNITIFTDVCLCAYTENGHCGITRASLDSVRLRSPQAARDSLGLNKVGGLRSQVSIDNKKTLEALSRIALAHAKSGADWVAPSAMAKEQVLSIRNALDRSGFTKVKVMGYSAKFASNFYGPFREAANSAPRFGDRRSYQLDYLDYEKAAEEIQDDINEGADMVMVKPALSYLDIIRQAKDNLNCFSKNRISLAAYNVSGEYAMVKYASRRNICDERKIVTEILSSIKRAGADYIITYHAKDAAKWLKESY
ncbi:MAG: porphobilinogen synthase [Candidatus Omnitrophota bacterium]|jgi:porphobilinogen synthase|nr:MAG: porphobilinogen synthase [Candidatus Omnitrophota bacterium]